MKTQLLRLSALALITALLAFSVIQTVATKQVLTRTPIPGNKLQLVKCSPDWNALTSTLEETDIPPVPGAGIYKWKISTRNDSAQFYFNQGINMYYSFHIIESMASFKKAAKFDPSSPMLYWAQALAYGPNINDVGYAASPEALEAVRQAISKIKNGEEKERMLIKAQEARYSSDSSASREKLNQLYVDKMKEAYKRYPADPDVAALYADALMLQHPWDLWKMDGTPKPWTPLIRNVLEKLLASTPDHPGANHYYIHVMEPSPYAIKALPSADRLGRLTPGLSHTVHMPSHIYLRTGQYSKGVAVNEAAVKSYKRSISLFEPVTGNAFLYIIHNLHMQTNHALMTGQSAYSAKSARETVNSIPVEFLQTPGALGNAIQYLYSTPVFSDIRFGNWNQVLTYPEPDHKLAYAKIIYHFGRGMALAANSRFAESKHELSELREIMKDTVLKIPFAPFSAAIEGAVVAENILSGTLALDQKQYDVAIRLFRVAAETEEKMVYNEPRDWLLNPKHYLANAYLKNNQPVEAIITLQKDLLNNNENGWALFGIWQALTIQKKHNEAKKMLARFRKAFEKADVKLSGPVF